MLEGLTTLSRPPAAIALYFHIFYLCAYSCLNNDRFTHDQGNLENPGKVRELIQINSQNWELIMFATEAVGYRCSSKWPKRQVTLLKRDPNAGVLL